MSKRVNSRLPAGQVPPIGKKTCVHCGRQKVPHGWGLCVRCTDTVPLPYRTSRCDYPINHCPHRTQMDLVSVADA